MASVTDQQPWTIKRLLDWTSDFFKSKELDSPRLCAEILLAEALGCERIQLYTRFDQVPDETELGKYRDWVKRHAKGEPVAYLVGHKEFYSMKFEVDSNALIPRPETEHLVVSAIEFANGLNGEFTIVDVGTGSGCIAIALANQVLKCRIIATDISEGAISVAKRNAELHNLTDRIEFVVSDLFESVAMADKPAIIVSNPPYIGTSELESVDESVKLFEPEYALFAGKDGTKVIRQLVEQSASHLAVGGALIFETSPVIFDQCLEIVDSQGCFTDTQTIKDLAGHRRIIQTVKSS